MKEKKSVERDLISPREERMNRREVNKMFYNRLEKNVPSELIRHFEQCSIDYIQFIVMIKYFRK